MTKRSEKEILQNVDEAVEMISKGEEGMTSQGTMVKKITKEELNRRNWTDFIMSTFSYFIIPIVILSVYGLKFGFDKIWAFINFFLPFIVMVLLIKWLIGIANHEPWHDVGLGYIDRGKTWYKYWRWFE